MSEEKRSLIKVINYALEEFGLFTKAKCNTKVKERFNENNSGEEILNYAVTSGIPPGTAECSRCKKEFPTSEFKYYQSRIDGQGYLMRSNALCSECDKKEQNERKEVFDRDEHKIPPKPEKGSICPSCGRRWEDNWHKHHTEEDGFIEWQCSNCNMAWQNNRNPKRFKDTE